MKQIEPSRVVVTPQSEPTPAVVHEVIKRDGRIEQFDLNKILVAATKCYQAINKMLPESVQEAITKRFSNPARTQHLEDIQDALYKIIRKDSRAAGKEFKRYREQRNQIRDMYINGTYYDSVLSIVNGEQETEVFRENANKDATTLSTMRDLIAGETCKKIYRQLILDPVIMDLHDRHVIHFHDMDYRLMKGITNCFSRDTKFITSDGVKSFNDYVDGDVVYVPTHKGNWKKATVHSHGTQDVYEYTITTTNRPGYGVTVKATENHRWFLSSGVETTNLEVGDALLTKNDLITHLSDDEIKADSTLNMYWCIGFVLGDGSTLDTKYCYKNSIKKLKRPNSIQFKTCCRLCGAKMKYLDRFVAAGYGVHNIKNSSDKIMYTTLFDKREFLEKRQYFKIGRDEKIALVRGLLAADGGNQRWNGDINNFTYTCIAAGNPYIQEIIETLAPMAGYFITSSYEKTGYTNLGRITRPIKHYHFTLQLLRTGRSKKHNEYKYQIPYKVASKKYIGSQDVWCLDVDDDHSFILDGGIITGNCCLTNMEDMLDNGTVMNGKKIRSPHSLRTAATVATQIILGITGSQYGGISWNISALSPYLRKSKARYEEFVDRFDSISEGDKSLMVNQMVAKELHDSIQTVLYQLNSMNTTNGQSPFVTIFCYEKGRKGYEKETAMLIEELFKQRLAGMESPDGHNINPAFPKLIYVLTEENIKPGHKLTQLAAECSSKRMVPDYISEKKMKEYKEGNCFSMMGK